jgi:outer membrane protein assembly factor BamE (lipoprotein component of BamABCDE complex)
VDFGNAKVTGWRQGSRTLKVSTGYVLPGASPIRIGSTAAQVTAVMGTPTSISQVGNYATWYYGTSSVDFGNAKVTGWRQGSRTLKVSTGYVLPGASPIRIGSTAAQVTAVMGTPQSVSTLGFGSSWWYYGLSTVEFENGVVAGWADHGDLTGKTTLQRFYKGVEEAIPFVTVSRYATALNIPKTQTTAIWQLPRTERVQSTVRLTSGSSFPFVAENGSYYGQISQLTGRPKTVFVHSYYQSDGTYVRSHYRSLPH